MGKCVRENSSYIQSAVGQWKIFVLNRLHILERKKNCFFNIELLERLELLQKGSVVAYSISLFLCQCANFLAVSLGLFVGNQFLIKQMHTGIAYFYFFSRYF